MSKILNFPVFDSEQVEVTDASVSLTLENNKLYYLSNASLSSIVISGVSSGFKYCGLSFESPAGAAPTFGVPASGFKCLREDCSNGVFTPEAGCRYHLAIEFMIDEVVIWVAKEEL